METLDFLQGCVYSFALDIAEHGNGCCRATANSQHALHHQGASLLALFTSKSKDALYILGGPWQTIPYGEVESVGLWGRLPFVEN